MADETKIWIEEFNAELHTKFQNKGGFFRPRVRVKTGVKGFKTHFPKFGQAGVALPKTRKGKVPMLDILRDRVACVLEDRYGADMVDDLDELKTNVAEKGAVQNEIVNSLARAQDDFALDAIMTSANTANALTSNDTYTTDSVFRTMVEVFGGNEAWEPGNMHAAVSWKGWNELLALNTFINADVGGDTAMTTEGVKAKVFYGWQVVPYSRLRLTTAKKATPFWNSRVVGLAIGQEITTETSWHADYDATLIKGKMSLGSVLIDETGVVIRQHNSVL